MRHIVAHHRSCDVVDSLPCESRKEFVCNTEPASDQCSSIPLGYCPGDSHLTLILCCTGPTPKQRENTTCRGAFAEGAPSSCSRTLCPLTVPRRWVGATRCVVSRPIHLSSIRAQHEALGGHALHPLSWCFCPSAPSSAQSGALRKRERQTPCCTSSRRCPHAHSGGHPRRRHLVQSPDRGPLRLGVRDALVGFPLPLKM